MVDLRRQVDFGLGYVQEGKGFAGSALARFFAGKHVIGRRGDCGSVFATRAQAGKWADQWAGGKQTVLLEGRLMSVVNFKCFTTKTPRTPSFTKKGKTLHDQP
jgi:hypothetical protein